MENLEGKVAFITGGASGIGFGMASAFLKSGIKVAIGDIAGERVRRASDKLKEISEDIVSLTVDTASENSLQRAAEEIEARFGNIHIVCNLSIIHI